MYSLSRSSIDTSFWEDNSTRSSSSRSLSREKSQWAQLTWRGQVLAQRELTLEMSAW